MSAINGVDCTEENVGTDLKKFKEIIVMLETEFP